MAMLAPREQKRTASADSYTLRPPLISFSRSLSFMVFIGYCYLFVVKVLTGFLGLPTIRQSLLKASLTLWLLHFI